MIYLASDHGGYQLKEALKTHLAARELGFTDLGCDDDTSCDYPDLAHPLARRVAAEPTSRGIAICGSGHGIGIALNRHAGIRAARCRDVEDARLARLHNDANILVLGGRLTDEVTAAAMVDVFLATAWEGGRHAARVEKIELPK